jgi:hypothetical protein
MSLFLLNNMLVEIVLAWVNANFAEQVNRLQSGLLVDRRYPNSP